MPSSTQVPRADYRHMDGSIRLPLDTAAERVLIAVIVGRRVGSTSRNAQTAQEGRKKKQVPETEPPRLQCTGLFLCPKEKGRDPSVSVRDCHGSVPVRVVARLQGDQARPSHDERSQRGYGAPFPPCLRRAGSLHFRSPGSSAGFVGQTPPRSPSNRLRVSLVAPLAGYRSIITLAAWPSLEPFSSSSKAAIPIVRQGADIARPI